MIDFNLSTIEINNIASNIIKFETKLAKVKLNFKIINKCK